MISQQTNRKIVLSSNLAEGRFFWRNFPDQNFVLRGKNFSRENFAAEGTTENMDSGKKCCRKNGGLRGSHMHPTTKKKTDRAGRLCLFLYRGFDRLGFGSIIFSRKKSSPEKRRQGMDFCAACDKKEKRQSREALSFFYCWC